MQLGARSRPSILLATRVLLILALVTANLAFAHSRLVADRPTAVGGVPAGAVGSCVTRCNETLIKDLQREYTLHKNVVRSVCGGNFVCHRDENYRHHSSLQAIIAGHKACNDRCPTQGNGTERP